MTVIGGIGDFNEHFKCRSSRRKKTCRVIKGHGVLGTARSSDEAYNMINGNAGSDVVLVYVKRASGDTEPLDDTYMEKKSLETQVTDIIHEIGVPAQYKGISVS